MLKLLFIHLHCFKKNVPPEPFKSQTTAYYYPIIYWLPHLKQHTQYHKNQLQLAKKCKLINLERQILWFWLLNCCDIQTHWMTEKYGVHMSWDPRWGMVFDRNYCVTKLKTFQIKVEIDSHSVLMEQRTCQNITSLPNTLALLTFLMTYPFNKKSILCSI